MSLANTWELEQLITGANAAVELGQADVPKWFAEKLAAFYARYNSTKDVHVTVHGGSITVERANGMPRVLVIGQERRWELPASATGTPPHAVNTPGQLTAILLDP